MLCRVFFLFHTVSLDFVFGFADVHQKVFSMPHRAEIFFAHEITVGIDDDDDDDDSGSGNFVLFQHC